MKNKKIALGIFILFLLSFLIPFLCTNYSFVTETQNSLNENREVKKAATKTAILRPNGDILTEWDGSPTPHWSRINEVNNDSVKVIWIDGDENQTESYAMENLDIINEINVTSVELHAYGFRSYTGPAFVSIYLGEWTSKLELNLPTTSTGDDWRTCVWNNLNGTYEDLMDLQVNISAGVWCDSSGQGWIDTLYCKITYDIVELPEDTAILRPNEDILIEWDGSPTPHWSRINEASPDEVYARWIDGDENQSDIFGMQDAYFENAIVTSVELHAYGFRSYTGPAFVSIYLGEWTSKLELNLPTAVLGDWRTCAWNNLHGTHEDLKDFQVNISAGVWCDSIGFGRIDTMYCVVTIEESFQVATPENITYTEPMAGYYPATYGFESDEVGENPFGWETVENGGPVEVVDYLDNHFKFVKLNDTIGGLGNDCILSQNFNSQIEGTIEFYFRLDSLNDLGRAIRLQNLTDHTAIHLKVIYDTFQYRDLNNNWHTFYENFHIDTWYHIRIDFNCATDTFDIFVNNNQQGTNLEFNNHVNSIEKIQFGTGQYAIVEMYIDAIGYSWDPNYNLGDNLNEGLLLSYDNTTALNWTGYSLDSQPAKTILGNSTIPMPEDGTHTIQLYGTDNLGRDYQSAVRYFTVDVIPVITNNPINLSVEYGYTGQSFSWTATDSHPSIYTIELAGTGIVAGPTPWSSGVQVNYNVPDGFALGDYLYTINFTDSGGKYNLDSVIFSVVDTTDPIIIDAPSDFNIEFGYTGISISWTATDLDPHIYTIKLQGSGIVAGPASWSSNIPIDYNIPDGLDVGEYIYTVNFTDDYDNFATHTVTINIEDTTDPIILEAPNDFTVDYGYSGANISWTATDPHPLTYTIELEGSGIVVGPTVWSSGVAITYIIPDGLAAGEYLYTINIIDEYGNTINHTVTMTVREPTGGVIPYELIIFTTVIGAGAIIGVASILIIRSRRKRIQ
ncbi:MAG: hypothetical protein ACFFCI_17160 [Promethearchaeota archaeon]